jgi:phosphoribosylglycinamide formyltransferase-1
MSRQPTAVRVQGLGYGSCVPGRGVAVLASGSGTILEAILRSGLPVVVVVTDRPCRAEQVAEEAGVPVRRLQRESFGADFDRDGYSGDVARAVGEFEVGVVAMAGFGTVLGRPFHDAYPGRVLNTHPALLPAFKGWHAVEAAIEAGVEETGCTVHIATLEVDDGPILAQESVKVLPGDSAETLHERIKEVERRLYPETIWRFLEEEDR